MAVGRRACNWFTSEPHSAAGKTFNYVTGSAQGQKNRTPAGREQCTWFAIVKAGDSWSV